MRDSDDLMLIEPKMLIVEKAVIQSRLLLIMTLALELRRREVRHFLPPYKSLWGGSEVVPVFSRQR